MDNASEQETLGCVWDRDDPAACFDESACGCYVDPCVYFGGDEDDCREAPEEICCTLIETC